MSIHGEYALIFKYLVKNHIKLKIKNNFPNLQQTHNKPIMKYCPFRYDKAVDHKQLNTKPAVP